MTTQTTATLRTIVKESVQTPAFLQGSTFPVYAFTKKGAAVRGAEAFNKHHHFCHVSAQEMIDMVRKYRISNTVLSRMLTNVGNTASHEGYVYISYDQYYTTSRKSAPLYVPLMKYLYTLPKETVIVSSNKFVLDQASKQGFKVLHRNVDAARMANIHHVVLVRGINHNNIEGITSLFNGVKVSMLTY